MILFFNKFDEQSGNLDKSFHNYSVDFDLTRYADQSIQKDVGKKIYTLTAILSHQETKENDESMYTAVVKKRVDGKKRKHWMMFNNEIFTMIPEKKALTYPA